MILSIGVGGEVTYPATERDVEDFLDRWAAIPYWKQPVRFAYSIDVISTYSDVSSYMFATLDPSGYGGAIWGVTRKYPIHEPPFDELWVSDTKKPPAVDPQVMSDPHVPTFFDPRSVLPFQELSAAVKEYCRSGDGSRPELIDWVVAVSDNGARLDRSE